MILKITIAGLVWLAIATDPAFGRLAAQPVRQLSWTVTSTPVLEIGKDGSGLFGTVSAATRSDEGIWFVADRAMNSIVVLEPDGSLRATIGREGDGPGEFRLIGTLYIDRAGNLNVFDRGQQRISIFEPDGAFVSDQRIAGAPGMVGGVAAFASGLRLGRTANSIVAAPVDGLASDSVEFFRIDEAGAASGRIAVVSGGLSTQVMIGGHAASRFALFSPVPHDAIGGECVYLTSAAEPVVTIVHSSGRAIDRIVLPLERRRVEAAHRRAWIDATAEQAGMPEGSPERSMIEQLGTQIRAAEHLPFFNDLIVDELGYVWLQLYEPPTGNSREWMVLDGDGRQLGRMQMPVAGDVLHISADRVAVKWVEETGEEILRIYTLARGNETASVVPDACRL